MLGLTGAALIQWLYFVAIDRLPVGIALLIEFTGPLMVAVYSRVVLRHTLHGRAWLALALALGGLALVAQVWRDVGLDSIGLAAAFGAAGCLATFHLLGKHTLHRRDPCHRHVLDVRLRLGVLGDRPAVVAVRRRPCSASRCRCSAHSTTSPFRPGCPCCG